MSTNVGDSINAENARWSFSGEVPKSFENHANRSVPFYQEGHALALKISDFFLTRDSVCYDLGCSTGLLTGKIADRNKTKNVSVIGLDIEEDMISFAKMKNKDIGGLQFVQANIAEAQLEKSDMIVAYYTIQFIRPSVRQLVFNKIYESLNWGGAFLLFEKVRGADARFQDISTLLYTEFKLENGFSPENIITKSRSLKGVLEPFSSQGNLDLLTRAGFKDIMTIMKYVCFEGFLSIK